jgi:DNA-binding ferritin-like protein
MQIEIIKFNDTIEFGIYLNSFLSKLKLIHWYTRNINFHKILNDTYKDLNDIFDSFQEEIIQSSEDTPFPFINYDNLNTMNICKEDYLDDEKMVNLYKKIVCEFKNVLSTNEFKDFCSKTSSGINNKKEEIFSILNESLYLLNMCFK